MVCLALGPLTQVASHLRRNEKVFERIIVVGGRPDSRGLFHPYWPHEFNFVQDIASTRVVFDSDERLFLVALDQAERLSIGIRELDEISGIHPWLTRQSRRWLVRNMILKLRPRLILWDVVAVLSETHPQLFDWKPSRVTCDHAARVRTSEAGREIMRLVDFDVDRARAAFMDELRSSVR